MDKCVVCRNRKPAHGAVCDRDRDKITDRLTDLPARIAALQLQLVPSGTRPRADRVSTSHTGSAAPVRIAALTMLGPGSDGLSTAAVAGMLHPQIRKWSVTEKVTVVDSAGNPTERAVTTWHQELVRDSDGRTVHITHDDQSGFLPPAEWLDSWARAWRAHYGHHKPARPARGAGKTRAHAAAAVVTVLGRDGYGGLAPVLDGDPLAEEWETRFGEPAADQRIVTDTHYLLTWLDRACDDDVGIADFSAELAVLHAELGRILGETPDQQWLGRCPATLARDGDERICGAGLWHDPYVDQVACPRCHSTWGPGPLALLRLAADIRNTWPLDRRRRYTHTERVGLLLPRCPGCGKPIAVTWADTTVPGEPERTWRPTSASCLDRCGADLGQVM